MWRGIGIYYQTGHSRKIQVTWDEIFSSIFFFCFWKNFSKLRFLIFLICKRTLDSSCSFRHHFCCLILTQPFESINFPGFVVILTIRNSLFLFFFNCSSNETFSFWSSAIFLKLLYIRLTCTLAFSKIIQFIENI